MSNPIASPFADFIQEQKKQKYLKKIDVKMIASYHIAYYETTEIRDSQGRLLLPAGLRVDSTFTFTNPITNSTTSPIKPVLFLDIERKKNDAKRNIVLLRSQYAEKLSEEFNSLRYGRSSQFIDRGIKLVSNPNL